MKLPSLACGFFAACACAATAFGQVTATYRCIDPNGRSIYTNVKEEMTARKCTVVSREVSVVPAPPSLQRAPPAPAAGKDGPTRASAVKAPAATSASRANDRRRILQEELDDEQKRLAEAKQKLAEQQSVRSGNERNYQRVIDRLKPYVEAIDQHEKNIGQLKRELSAAR